MNVISTLRSRIKVGDLRWDIVLMAILLSVSSYFRASYLTYEILPGGDTGYHIAVSKMTLESLPFTPIYDRFSKGSMPHLYPPVTHYLVALVAYITHMEVQTAFKYTMFIVNALMVIPVYLIVSKIDGRLSAFISGIFVAATPAFYEESLHGGFSAMNLGLLLATIPIYFMVSEKTRLVIITTALVFYTHPVTFTPFAILLSAHYLWNAAFYGFKRNMEKAKKFVSNYLAIIIGVFALSLGYLTLLYYPPMYSLKVGSAQNLSAASFWEAASATLSFIIKRLPSAILLFGLLGAIRICIHKKNHWLFSWLLAVFIGMVLNRLGILTIGEFRWHKAFYVWSIGYVILAGTGFTYLVELLDQAFPYILKFMLRSDVQKVWGRFSRHLSLLAVAVLLGLMFHRAVAFTPPSPTISIYDVDAMTWLKENTEPYAVIVTKENEGYWLEALAERISVVGGYSLPFTDVFTRLNDIHRIYWGGASPEEIEGIMRSYGANYLYTHRPFDFDNLKLVYNNTEVYIYRLAEPVQPVELRKVAIAVRSSTYLQDISKWEHTSGLIKDGPAEIDDLSEDELKQYSGLILSNYGYRIKYKIARMLSDYLERGGRIMIVYDLEKPLFDIEAESFKSKGNLEMAAAENYPLIDNVDVDKFSPAEWNDNPWRFVEFKDPDVKPLLKIQNRTVMGILEEGSGAILLDGMNIVYHAYSHGNKEETKFIANIIDWLCRAESEIDGEAGITKRSPTHLRIEVNTKTIPVHMIVKQPYYPGWECLVDGRPHEVNRIFQYMVVPITEKGFHTVELTYSRKPVHQVGGIISLLSLVMLTVWDRLKKFRLILQKHLVWRQRSLY